MKKFSLRLYKNDGGDNHINQHVGMFETNEEKPNVHIYTGMLPDNEDWSNCSLMIYPADASKNAFYNLTPKESLFVYYTDEESGSNVQIGFTPHNDCYFYFKPPKRGLKQILVVTSTTQDGALKMIS